MTDVYPHLQRYRFVAALASHGPEKLPQRRFLMVLTAMADHWSLVAPDVHTMAAVFNVSATIVRDWVHQFHEEKWLSDVPDTDLSVIHLPEGSAAYQALEPVFEWHTRSHAPVGGWSRAITTHVKSQNRNEAIPLSRARQLAVSSAGQSRRKQFAYISFVQESLSTQPLRTEGLPGEWNRYLEG
jgi:hypothetical protein